MSTFSFFKDQLLRYSNLFRPVAVHLEDNIGGRTMCCAPFPDATYREMYDLYISHKYRYVFIDLYTGIVCLKCHIITWK